MEMPKLQVTSFCTKPFDGQKPGTSGLRKATKIFQQPNYTENFTQCILTSVGARIKGSTLVLGGDGRYFVAEAVKIILPICAANGVKKVLVGQNGILSTPAVSVIIRKYQTDGGILLTASHNPGGPDNDFGIKFNVANGGPAPESVTAEIYRMSTEISNYFGLADKLEVDISKIGSTRVEIEGSSGSWNFDVEVIDSVDDYQGYMRQLFDFPALRAMLTGSDGLPKVNILVNALHGVMGSYVTRILVDELGMDPSRAVKCNTLPDFGGGHPDPNLTYAADLVEAMRSAGQDLDLGAAFDGDGDRNMILGSGGFFVSPCDSLAAIAAHLDAIPYFRKAGVKGVARSMPTSAALDRVAAALNVACYEVPTGWKFFGNLMDTGSLSLCGEESFGTGSNHIREKDGLWALLAWMSILCDERRKAKGKVSVASIMAEHWRRYGRNFFTRYDYENCESAPAEQMMRELGAMIERGDMPGKTLTGLEKTYTVRLMDNFRYTDPVDHSVSANQGIRIIFTDGSRIVFRLSGTGSSGATIRLYVEAFESDPAVLEKDAQEMLKPLVTIALELSRLQQLTGRDRPTVIT